MLPPLRPLRVFRRPPTDAGLRGPLDKLAEGVTSAPPLYVFLAILRMSPNFFPLCDFIVFLTCANHLFAILLRGEEVIVVPPVFQRTPACFQTESIGNHTLLLLQD